MFCGVFCDAHRAEHFVRDDGLATDDVLATAPGKMRRLDRKKVSPKRCRPPHSGNFSIWTSHPDESPRKRSVILDGRVDTRGKPHEITVGRAHDDSLMPRGLFV